MNTKLLSTLVMAGFLVACAPAPVKDDAAASDDATAQGQQTGDSAQVGGLDGTLGHGGRQDHVDDVDIGIICDLIKSLVIVDIVIRDDVVWRS